MPIYLFKNPNTGKTISVFQSMNEEHTYSEDGIKYERVFTIPNAQIDTEFDIDSSSKFVEKTGNMKGTLGEIWDYSQELSNKRASKYDGVDPLRQKAEEKYSKKRKGMKYKSKVNPSEMPKISID
jgi:thymidylate synthase